VSHAVAEEDVLQRLPRAVVRVPGQGVGR
jgi:hypothetical protein